MSRAQEIIERFAARRPFAVRLAEAVSLAVLVDPPLLRKARLDLVPGADPGAEADLWLSPLVQTRSPDGIVFSNEIAEALRSRLAADAGRLDRAWRTTQAMHRHLTPALRLEEEIAWLSVSSDPGAADRIEELLRSALAALVMGERRGLAHWFARALPTLPSRVRVTETARMLEAGAHLRLRGDARSLDADEETLDWLPWVAPADLPRVAVGVRRFPDAVELDARPEPTGQKLLLPQTDPLLVDLSWHDPKKGVRSGLQVTFRKGEVQKVPVSAEDVRLRTILGEVYDLRAAGTAPPSLRDWIIDFSEERERHRPFFGREEELERIQQRLKVPRRPIPPGVGYLVLVTGEVGVGKSALLAHTIDRLAESGFEPPHHFFSRGRTDIAVAERSLIAQIVKRFPEVASSAPHLRLSELLVSLARQDLLSSDEPLVLVLDAIDQAERSEGSASVLHAILPPELPDHVMVLASSQEDIDHRQFRQWPSVHIPLMNSPSSLRSFWAYHGERNPDLPWLKIATSPVTFGVAKVLLATPLRWGEPRLIYEQEWNFLEWIWDEMQIRLDRERVVAWLGALAAVREPLPSAILYRITGEEPFPQILSPFVSFHGTEGEPVYELREEVLRGFISSRLDLKEHHRRLAEVSLFVIEETGRARQYWLRHAADHWLAAGELERALLFLTPAQVLTVRCRELGIPAVCRDLRRWLAAEAKSRKAREILQGLSFKAAVSLVSFVVDILTQEAARIESRPEDLPSLLYNHLRARGLDPGTIQDHLQLSEAPPLRLAQTFPEEGLRRRPLVRHRGNVTGCAFVDADGPAVLSWSTDGTLRLWDVTKGDLKTVLTGHSAAVTGCALLEKGRVVSASRDCSLRMWDIREGSLIRTMWGHGGEVLGVLALDARMVVSWSADRTIRVWDLTEGREVMVLRGHEGAVTSCAVTGSHLVSGSEDTTVRTWDLSTGVLRNTWRGHTAPVTGIAVQEKEVVISVSEDRTVRFWHLLYGPSIYAPEGHRLGILGCALWPSNSLLATWSYDRTVRLWPPGPGWRELIPGIRHSITLAGHEGAVLSCAFLSEGDRVVSCSADRSARIWDVESGEPVAVLLGHDAPVRAVTVKERIVTASDDRTLRVWNTQGQEEAVLDGDNETLFCLPFQDRRRALTFSRFGDIRIHHFGESVPQWVGSPSMAVGGGVLVQDDRRLILWSENLVDGKVRFAVWDLAEQREVAVFYGHDGPILAAVTPNSGTLVTASMDGSIRHWSLVNWLELPAVEEGISPVSALAAASAPQQGALLAFRGSWDGTVVPWLLNQAARESRFTGHTDRVLACAISPDFVHAVSASADQTLRLWDFKEEARVLRGHTAEVTGCAFTRDGTRIVSRSKDGRLGLWDGESGDLVAFAEGHTDWVNAFAIAEDEGVVYSASEDQTVRAWDLATGEPRGVVYGVSPFRSLAAVAGGVYAGDEAGNLWVLEYGSGRPAP